MNKINTLLALVTIAILSGCGTARIIVTDHPEKRYSSSNITIQRSDSTVQVPDEMVSHFDSALRKELMTSFTTGKDLTVEYRFVSFQQGDRFKRYLAGGIGNWGEGNLIIEAKYIDSEGAQIAKVQTDAKIDSGFFGGSIKSALEKAAKELSDYTISNFRG